MPGPLPSISTTVSSLHGRSPTARAPKRRARRALLAACAAILCLSAACLPAGAIGTGSVSGADPSPPVSYQVRPACSTPAPGLAGCLALELVPVGRGAPLQARPALTRPLHAHAGLSQQMQPTAAGRGHLGAGGLGGGDYASGQTPEPLEPKELLTAYNLPSEPLPSSAPQTIALVDAHNDLAAEADLSVYDTYWHLAACTSADGCFTKVDQSGAPATEGGSGTPFPKSTHELEERETACKAKQKTACAEVEEAAGWNVEISTDLDVAHSLCQSCHILLVEASSAEYQDLAAAEDTAVSLGATEVSNSWGGPEPASDSAAFDHPGTVIVAAAGDNGYLNWTEAEAAGPGYFGGADYPASSPHVVAVGGTELTVTKAGARRSETVWNEDPDPSGGNQGAGGGGCSSWFAAPEWELEMTDWAAVGCGTGSEAKRAVADVAADADPYSGVLVYDSRASKENLLVIGGTSVASPIVASAFALAGGAHGVAYPAQTLYFRHGRGGNPSLYDVTEGGNGRCDGAYTKGCSGSLLSPLDCGAGALICNASRGYDGPTGVGAPNGIAAFEPESEAEHTQKVQAEAAAEETKASEAGGAEKKAAEERLAEEERRVEEAKRRSEEEAQAQARRAEEERAAVEAGARAGGSGGGLAAGSGVQSSAAGGPLTGGLAESQTPQGSLLGGRPPTTRVRLSALALTPSASAALARGVPALSQVAFAFVLSAPARVRVRTRVTLARQVVVRGRARWVVVTGGFTLAAARGRDHGRLRGRGALAPGRYRLTLAPARGAESTIVFVAQRR
jgi:hypothetical protein